MIVFVVAYFFIIMCPFYEWGLTYLESRYPRPTNLPDDIEGFILLGSGFRLSLTALRQEPVYNHRAGRLIEFMRLIRHHPHHKFIFSGAGFTPNDTYNESQLVKMLLQDLFPESLAQVTFEGRSRTTAQNARYSAQLVADKLDKKWVLVTSAAHMPRSVQLFHKVGFTNILPYPVDYLSYPTYYLRFKNDPMRAFLGWRTLWHEGIGNLYARLSW